MQVSNSWARACKPKRARPMTTEPDRHRGGPPPSSPACAFTRVPYLFPSMARRSTSQKKIDDAAFPVRVRIVVPGYGFGPDLIAMRRWLSTEIGDADHAAHGASIAGMDACAFHFRDLSAARSFMAAFPDLELADGTATLTYSSVNTAAMNLHLAEISRTVAPGAHAVLVLDGAGWHSSKTLIVPENISLLSLPPYSPELNPPNGDCRQSPVGQRVENVWQFLRANWLAISVFDDYPAIVAPSRKGIDAHGGE